MPNAAVQALEVTFCEPPGFKLGSEGLGVSCTSDAVNTGLSRSISNEISKEANASAVPILFITASNSIEPPVISGFAAEGGWGIVRSAWGNGATVVTAYGSYGGSRVVPLKLTHPATLPPHAYPPKLSVAGSYVTPYVVPSAAIPLKLTQPVKSPMWLVASNILD